MVSKRSEVVSAQVLLRSAAGRGPDGRSVITSRTIDRFAPSHDAVALATTAFRAAGFKVGPVVGNSFSITGPVPTFEKFFGTHLRRSKARGMESARRGGSKSLELPLENLPKSLGDVVAAVTFTPPPDFGPTRFGP